MSRKVSVCLLILALLGCAACSEAPSPQSPSPPPSPVPSKTAMIVELYNDPYVGFYTFDLYDVIESSDTIVLGRVEETLPAELSVYSANQVVTPANIKVIRQFKGKYMAGDILKIYQLGGVAGGIDFRPASTYIHDNGETYLFFVNDAYRNVLHSEHVTESKMLDGYFFSGKTADEAASLIDDCVINGKMKIDKQRIKSFRFEYRKADGIELSYYVDKAGFKAEADGNGSRHISEEWDAAQWDDFINELEACGVFDWKKHYVNETDIDGPDWILDMEIDIGRFTCTGVNSFPDGWDDFLDILEEYFGDIGLTD